MIQNFCETNNQKKQNKLKYKNPEEILLQVKNKRNNDTKLLYFNKNIEKKCFFFDKYIECVNFRRSIGLLKENARIREKAIEARGAIKNIAHDALPKDENLKNVQSLIHLNNLPTLSGHEFSVNEDLNMNHSMISMESKDLQEYCKFWNFENPIVLQEQLQGDSIFQQLDNKVKDITRKLNNILEQCCKKCCTFYCDFDQTEICADCMRLEEDLYIILADLEKNFKANIILGTDKIDRLEIIKKIPQKAATLCGSEEELEDKPTVSYRNFLPIACLYVALAVTYEIRDEDWSSETIDEILEDGEDLQDKSIELNYRNENGNFDIIPEISDKSIMFEISCPLYAGILTYSNPNVFKALSLFFQEKQACIFQSHNVFLLIWKQCQYFNVFDPNGRNNECKRDDENGKAALIKTKPLINVIHIIVNLSGLQFDERYKIYEICITDFQYSEEKIAFSEPIPKIPIYILRINKFYSLVPAAIGIDQDDFPDDENISMFISFVAILYSQIEPSKFWTRRIITQLIKSSIDLYDKYLEKHQLLTFDVKNLPKIFALGTNRIVLNTISYFYSGHIHKCFTFKHSSLTQALQMFFQTYRAGLIQIENSTLGIWCTSEPKFYVFDPFKRSKTGTIINEDEEENEEVEEDSDEDDEDDNEGFGCLQIHDNFDSMCRMLYWNSLEMMEDTGNFFLHAIEIESIDTFNLNTNIKKRDLSDVLKIECPILCESAQIDVNENDIYTSNEVPDNCLSQLSVSPCQRTCSESEFKKAQTKKKQAIIKRQQLEVRDSLTSLDENVELVPEFDDEEIVEETVRIIMCKVMTRITAKLENEEQEIKKAIFGSQKHEETETKSTEELSSMSSNEYLDKYEKQSFQNLPKEMKARPITVEEEIKFLSKFIPLPDGNWIIFGHNVMSDSGKDQLNVALFASIIAGIISRFHSIRTWNSNLIDYVIQSAENAYKTLNLSDTITPILKSNLPEFVIGTKFFKVSTKNLKITRASKLRSALIEYLQHYPQLLIICNTYVAAVFKRYNFFYLFVAFPCDLMGFRVLKANGNPCFLRFLCIDSLIARINFNRFNNDSQQEFLIIKMSSKQILVPNHSFDDGKENEEMIKSRIRLEEEKFQFKQQLARKGAKKRKSAKKSTKTDAAKQLDKKEEGLDKKEELDKKDENSDKNNRQIDDNESDIEIEFKHKPGVKLSQTNPIYEEIQDEKSEKLLNGYQLCAEDCQFKIQGTFALENRKESDRTKIRACFFTAVYAIMNAIVQPLSKWNSNRVDKVLEHGLELFKKLDNPTTFYFRQIKNVIVDNFVFDLKVIIYKAFEERKPLDLAIEQVIKTKRYFIIQLSNISFAVHKDQCFHLFDPYESSSKSSKNGQNKEIKKCSDMRMVETVPHVNAASWILFTNLKDMLNYISDKAVSDSWQLEYRIHFIETLSYRKTPERTRFQFKEPNVRNLYEHEDGDNISLSREKISWLNKPIPWTRLSYKLCEKQFYEIDICRNGAFTAEIPGQLYSLWACNEYTSNVEFGQILATNVITCCMAHIYRFTEWNHQIMDTILEHGDNYYKNSLENLENNKFGQFKIENLDTTYSFDRFDFQIHIEGKFIGILYNMNKRELNLSSALKYLFSVSRYGILQCKKKVLAIGKGSNEYFMFDCQSKGNPLLKKNRQKAYLLWCKTLQMLLCCIVKTLGIRQYNVHFSIHSVDINPHIAIKDKESRVGDVTILDDGDDISRKLDNDETNNEKLE